MRTLTLGASAAREALRPFTPLLFILAAALLTALALFHPQGWLALVALFGSAIFFATAIGLSPANLLIFYFAYLMFEGGLKIISNYNIVVRFGSDALLCFAFLRLMGRYQRLGNDSLLPEVRSRFGTLTGAFTLFWIWVAVQFLNPWGLGLLPSIAGLKVYLIPLLVFFAVGIYMRDEELDMIPFLLLGMGIFESVVSVIDWLSGPMGLPMMHPKYAQVLWDFLQGFPYRPFGTTNLPGAPALWMFHCLTGALVALARLRNSRKKSATLWRIGFGVFVLCAFTTLIACQVRLSLLRFLALLSVGLFIVTPKKAVIYTALIAGLIAWVLAANPTSYDEALSKRSFVKIEDRLTLAIARLATLKSAEQWSNARGGNWAVNELANRAAQTTSGIGLSRVGAAATPWVDRIQEDRYFTVAWGFADNLILALFTELGIGGVVGYVFLVLTVLVKLLGVGTRESLITGFACGLLFVSGWASEGILFQPDASMFWLTAAFGLRTTNKEDVL